MKRLLFAATAFIALAGMASAEIKFSGHGRFGIGYQEDRGNEARSAPLPAVTPEQQQVRDRHEMNIATTEANLVKEGITGPAGELSTEELVGPPANSNISDTVPVSRFRLNIDGIAETDRGVRFEARVRLQAEDDKKGEAGKGDLNGARFSSIVGGLRVDAGNVGGAFDNLPTRASYYGREPGLEDIVNQYSGVNYSFLSYDSTESGANAVFANFRVGNFELSASYDGNSTVTIREVAAVGDYVGTSSTMVENIDRWDMSVAYTFGTHIFGDITAALAHGQNDIDESLTSLTLGAEFGNISGVLLVAEDKVISESLNGTVYGLSAAYDLGLATTVNFAYGNGSATSDTRKFGFGLTHALGGGVSLNGGIGQTKVGGGDGRLQADFGAHFNF